MFDTHVHLQFKDYTTDREAVLERAVAAGVSGCILPGSALRDSREGVKLAEQSTQSPCPLYAAIGYHPGSADEVAPETLRALRDLARRPRVVAIGEIGLDYYWPTVPNRRFPYPAPPRQRQAFLDQLELAAELALPVIIHDRDAHADTLDILRDWVRDGPGRTGTVHAYAGGPQFLDRVLELGFYIGMDGPVTFSKATDLHEVARRVPLERLLLETDGPYLTPQPHRGQRNEPAYLTYIARRIAELRNIPPAVVIHTTTQNARQLFLSRQSEPPAAPGMV